MWALRNVRIQDCELMLMSGLVNLKILTSKEAYISSISQTKTHVPQSEEHFLVSLRIRHLNPFWPGGLSIQWLYQSRFRRDVWLLAQNATRFMYSCGSNDLALALIRAAFIQRQNSCLLPVDAELNVHFAFLQIRWPGNSPSQRAVSLYLFIYSSHCEEICLDMIRNQLCHLFWVCLHCQQC